MSTADLVSDLRETLPDHGATLITTNLDNDDGLAVDFSSRLASVVTSHERAVIYVSRGLIKSPTGLFLRTDRRNAFVSVLESWDSPVTSWSEYHNEFPRIMPSLELGGRPGWLQVVHGSNVSNRVRGVLVSPGGYRDEFGDLLDDVAQPTRRDLGTDLLVRYPARALRDGSRAAVRTYGLRLLGKERYGQVKLKLATLRRSG